nr:hypothetical protein [Streptomyces sp. FT05W]
MVEQEKNAADADGAKRASVDGAAAKSKAPKAPAVPACATLPGRRVHGTGSVFVSHPSAISRRITWIRSSRDIFPQPSALHSCLTEGPWPCAARNAAAASAAAGPWSGYLAAQTP